MPQRPPAFQFYIDDYRGSRAVQRMTYAQRGMYLEMLIEQWDKGAVPDCPRACADLLGGVPEPGRTIEDEWIAHWPILRRKFVVKIGRAKGSHEFVVPSDSDPSRLIVNLRLERYRRSLRAFKSERSASGRKGGIAKARNTNKNEASLAIAQPDAAIANSGSSSSTPSPTPTPTPFVGSNRTEPAVDARSKRPIFKGQRFVVHEWQLDDLRRMLGSHTEAFDLHAWFFDLDAKAAAAGVVVPQRDGGRWLQDEALAEASRRGIPIAASTAAPFGKTAGNQAAAARFVARGQR
jgi:hypothetical protein